MCFRFFRGSTIVMIGVFICSALYRIPYYTALIFTMSSVCCKMFSLYYFHLIFLSGTFRYLTEKENRSERREKLKVICAIFICFAFSGGTLSFGIHATFNLIHEFCNLKCCSFELKLGDKKMEFEVVAGKSRIVRKYQERERCTQEKERESKSHGKFTPTFFFLQNCGYKRV